MAGSVIKERRKNRGLGLKYSEVNIKHENDKLKHLTGGYKMSK